MLLLSTTIKVNDNFTKEAFVQSVIDWNQGSPFKENVIRTLEWNGEMNIRYKDEHLLLGIEEFKGMNTVAVRFEKRDKDGAVWGTELVTNFDEKKMTVRLERSYLETAAITSDDFSVPHFLNIVIDRGYLADDYNLPVIYNAIGVNEENMDILLGLVKGNRRYEMPVIYVSKTKANQEPVNIKGLAYKLKGVAHVIVQDELALNESFKSLCAGRNEYNGAIGIYYPNGGHNRYLYRKTRGWDNGLFEKVVQDVIAYSNNQMVGPGYTWQGINNAILRTRLAASHEARILAEKNKERAENEIVSLLASFDEEEIRIKKEALAEATFEANTILESFEEDLQRQQEKIEELTNENIALQCEVQGLRAKLIGSDKEPLIYTGNEVDIYSGEIKDILLSVLSDIIDTLPEGSRRRDVVADIIENNDFKRESERRGELVKQYMKTYKELTTKLRQDMSKLGIEFYDENHYRVIYGDDNRYHTTVAKTPSNHKTGPNTAQFMKKYFF